MMKEWILYFAVLEMKVWLVWDQVMKIKWAAGTHGKSALGQEWADSVPVARVLVRKYGWRELDLSRLVIEFVSG
jgi:hypothetical protein